MTNTLTTERLALRPFTEADMTAIFEIFGDVELNRFLPWFPIKSPDSALDFYRERLSDSGFLAICLREDDRPIGYVSVDGGEAHDLGYGILRPFRRQGIVTEACAAVIARLRSEGVPFVTATHDRNNPRSGEVMKRLGMTYRYSYEEQWQPKNFPVIFRMYQLDLDGGAREYSGYREKHGTAFVEEDI